jgi:hypothetical protein
MKTNQSAIMPNEAKRAETVNLRKRIGSTTYIVSFHFSEISKETVEDKLLRLIEGEVAKFA